MSFVSSEYSRILDESIQMAIDNGIVVVGSAGNGGVGDNTIQYPAKYPGVISVGAVDTFHNKASFSATGQGLDLVAPGVNILSTTSNGLYGTYSGTSQAAAHVTGALALLWSHEPSLSAIQIEQLIGDSATILGPSNEYGRGLINIAKASGVISGAIAPLGGTFSEDGMHIWLPPTDTDTEGLEIASYDWYGNGMTYEPGQMARVGLKLEGNHNGENLHNEIIIELYYGAAPATILSTATIVSPQLNLNYEFIWQIPMNAATGQYFIKYRYPAYPDGSWDDLFEIYVTQAGIGPDTYEPNDTQFTAYPVNPGNTYTSYLSSASDNDFYKFTAVSSGQIDLSLIVPTGKDYELQVYNSNGIIAYDPKEGNETLSITVDEGSVYYIRIFGYYGDFSINPYLLILSNVKEVEYAPPTGLLATSIGDSIKITWNAMPNALEYLLQLNGETVGNTSINTYTFNNLEPLKTYLIGVSAIYENGQSAYSTIQASTSIAELYINQSRDVIATGDRLFTFNPPTSGVYRIYTSPLQSYQSDTILNVYSDANQTQLLFTNDDSDNSTFSDLRMNLIGGQTYYVKLSWYGFGEQSARITASVIASSIPHIQLNETININEQLENSTIYVFIPTRSGNYKISTNFYGGVAVGRENDTIIKLFSDINLTRPVAGGLNDDKPDSLFSEVNITLTQNIPYYIQVDEVTGAGVYAQLLVTSAGDSSYVPITVNNEELINLPQNGVGLYKFTPMLSDNYRIFTSGIKGEGLFDTVLEIYSDSDLTNLVGYNDDVIGVAYYGATYSKVDISLSAHSTYYIVVKSYDPRSILKATLMVEGAGNNSRANATPIEWGDVISTDILGNPLRISSYYDVDYYRIELLEPEQVYISTSAGMGAIEDQHGNIFGYFSQGGDTVFNLPPGTYYLKVRDDMFRRGSIDKPPYDYELTVAINDIEYITEYDSASGFSSSDVTSRNASFLASEPCYNYGDQGKDFLDATPGDACIDRVKWNYEIQSEKVVKMRIEIYAKTSFSKRLVYSQELNGNKFKGNLIVLNWFGQVNENTDFALKYSTPYSDFYYAKDGTYDIYVKEYTTSTRYKNTQTASVNVNNNPLERVNFVPLPPLEGTYKKQKVAINNSNAQKLKESREYYFQYIMPSYTEVPETALDAWVKQVYGLTKLENFWAITSNALLWNPGESFLDHFQGMLDVAGMVPVIGEGADAINGTIYFLRGQYADAVLSYAGMIPVLGSAGPAGRLTTKLLKVEHVLESCMDYNCMKAAYKNINKYHKQGSQKLINELGKVVKKPDLAPGIKDWQAHHIIPQGGGATYDLLRKKLKEADIDIHSAANGVWLPVKAQTKSGSVDKYLIVNSNTRVEWLVAAHKNHGPEYGEFLTKRLEGLTEKEDILHAINEVRELLLDGKIDLVNPVK